MDLLAGTSIDLKNVSLTAVYMDEDGVSHTDILSLDSETTFPYNANINMVLNFNMGDGGIVDTTKTYVYKLPDTVRVDVDAIHSLEDENGESIGEVHISRDGRLLFTFNDNIKANSNIPFYVQFEGGLSESLQEKDKSDIIKFPTATGNFSYRIKTEDSTNQTIPNEPGDIIVEKAGDRKINIKGDNYIEWKIALGPNGRDKINGEIVDLIPDGQEYVSGTVGEMNLSPRLEGEKIKGEGKISVTEESSNQVRIKVTDVATYWRAYVILYTKYKDAFTEMPVNPGESYSLKNEVSFVPDGETPVSATGTASFTPSLMEKEGKLNEADGTIDWTITVNAENIPLNGATYTDEIGEGHKLVGDINVTCTTNSDKHKTAEVTGNTFKVSDLDGDDTYVINYKTEITDHSKSPYKNKGKLEDGKISTGAVEKEISVAGLNLLHKRFSLYNPVTNTITWEIEVNNEKKDLKEVVVTDYFNTGGTANGRMEYFDSTVKINGVVKEITPTQTTEGENTKLTFELGSLSTSAVITVVTKIVNPPDYITSGKNFENTAELTSSLNTTAIKSSDNRWLQTHKPNLIDKDGVIKGDGTIDWKVTIMGRQDPLVTDKLIFSDILPDGMEYVKGSFSLQTQYYDPEPLYVEPVLDSDKKTISYELKAENSEKEKKFMQETFEIHYTTRTTDYKKANAETEYTNEAKVKITYEGYPEIEDTEIKTLKGVVGGLIDKKFDYKNGMNYVDWTVVVNEAKQDLSAMTNPYITDQLADYFDYNGGAQLIRVKEDGTEEEVPSDKFMVTVINNNMTVRFGLNDYNLGSDTYIYKFRTYFNCMAIQLKNVDVKNTVSFHGDDKIYLKESGSVQNINFSSSSAGSRIKREIWVKKVDKANTAAKLEGAVFQLKVGDIILGEAVTDKDGIAVFEDLSLLSQYTLTLVELQPPNGYTYEGVENKDDDAGYETKRDITTITGYNDANMESVTKEDGTPIKCYVVEIPNGKVTTTNPVGSIEIQKRNGDGSATLKGAVFGLYNSLTDAQNDENRILSKTTDSEGLIKISDLAYGTYYLREVTSPAGYVRVETPIEITIDASGTSYDGTSESTHIIKNVKAKGTLEITKKDTNGTIIVAPKKATFSLYTDANCQNRIATKETNASGIAEFSGLELGKTYYYREVSAPEGYILDTTIHSVVIGTAADTEDKSETVTVKNKKAVGDIEITKQDNSVPAVKLSGVKFTLYDNALCTHEVNKPGTTDPYTVWTNAYGVATFSNLPFGTYYIKETDTTVPAGYKANVTPVKVVVDKLGKTNVTVVNDRIRCDIKIKKIDGTDPLPGATFTLYTFAGAPVKSAVTGADGIAVFTDILYGDYYIKETQTPAGYNPPVLNRVDIAKEKFKDAYAPPNHTIDLTTTPVVNTKQNGSVTFNKLKLMDDGTTGILKGATFTLYDKDMMPIKITDSDESGKVSFTGLAYGKYYIRETNTLAGYKRDEKTYTVDIINDEPIINIKEVDSEDLVTEIVNNEIIPPFFSFKLKKTDGGTPEKLLANATFTLYMDDEPIATAISGSDGIAYFRRIKIPEDKRDSSFTIHETEAPAGYIKSDKVITLSRSKIELQDYSDGQVDDVGNLISGSTLNDNEIQYVGLDETAATVVNEEIKGTIEIIKNDDHNNVLPGAEFGIYTDSAATNPVKVGGKALTEVTGDDGVAVFNDLSFGTYYIREIAAPAGYTLNPEIKVIKLVGKGSDKGPVLREYFTDTPLSLTVSKLAVGGSSQIPGAKFALKIDGSGKPIHTWTSSSAPVTIPNTKLEAGEIYVITETEAPAGYGYMEDVKFKINHDGSLSVLSGNAEKNNKTLILRDKPISLTIQKVDNDNLATLLSGAVLAVYDEDTEVARFTTTDSGYTLPLGILKAPAVAGNKTVYTLKEISAPDDYETAAPITIMVAHDGTVTTNPASALADNTLTMKDVKKTNTDLYVRKWDANTHTDISGADFAIFDNEASFTHLSQAVERWSSDGTPHKLGTGSMLASFAGYTVDTPYYLFETNAPDGYVGMGEYIKFHITNDDAKHKIVIDQGGPLGDTELVNGDGDTFLIKNKPLEVNIRKQNAYGTVLKGAKLELWTYDTAADTKKDEIAVFESNGTGAYQVNSSELMINGDYILIETDAPDGYKKAEPIIFHIEENGDLIRKDGVKVFNNTIVMEDEEAALCIGKRDLDTKIGLAGSKLHLASLDDPHFVEATWVSDGTTKTWNIVDLTPGCTYELTELEAPDGYAYADPIRFKVDADTHDILVEGMPQENRTVYIEDGMLTLSVSKQNLITAEDIAGAEFIVLDETNTTVATWTSDGTLFMVDTSKMKAGVGKGYKEYTLRETKAPEGYHLADDLIFAFDTYGNLYHVTVNALGIKQYNLMEDNKITIYDDPMLCITKVTEAGTVLEGASLQITSKDDEGFTPIKWTSKQKPLYIDQNLLVPGKTYVLSELSAPKGYGVAKDIEFSVNTAGKLILNGTVTDDPSIKMTDAEIKVVIAKKDKETNELLADAKLAILNGKGESIYNFVSQSQAVTLPSELFVAPDGDKLRAYTLTEVEAPNGYEKAENIDFAIDKEGQVYIKDAEERYKKVDGNIIEMLDAKSGDKSTNTNSNKNTSTSIDTATSAKSPRTGDESPLALWLMLLIIGFAGMVYGCLSILKND